MQIISNLRSELSNNLLEVANAILTKIILLDRATKKLDRREAILNYYIFHDRNIMNQIGY
jgi:hypothetical protein